ncbi:MAG: 37S ribosomal protein S23 mitochondrial [Chrysothrix sp. TS-e1954]|nr:MAG: 37S ribosomal protein S23 mitochondrial [Chrysothrix sp. TS-e1954]
MTSTPCWRCLARRRNQSSFLRTSTPASFQSNLPTTFLPSTTRPFTTTPTPHRKVKPAPKAKTPNIRQTNKHAKTYKIPAIGERKALRKRVILSNTNALEVGELVDLSASHVSKAAARELQGSVVGFAGETVDQLRAAEGFKPGQGWGFFRRPAALVRKETVEMAGLMDGVDAVEPGNGGRETVTRLLAGEKWSGKSVLMLQTMAMAFLKGWVVISFPEAIELTNASTAYAPLPKTPSSPQIYTQKDYTSALLARIAASNPTTLSTLHVTQSHASPPLPLQPNSTTLLSVAQSGARDPETAQRCFEILWAELTTPTTPIGPRKDVEGEGEGGKGEARPPILMTLDGIAHISRLSEYLDAEMRHIHATDLFLPRLFLEYISGTRGFPQGGMVLAEHSASNRPPRAIPAVELALRQLEGLYYPTTSTNSHPPSHTNLPPVDPKNPYTPIDPLALAPLQRIPLLKLAALTKPEARAVMEYYARSGLLRGTVSEGMVSERWTVSGGGVVGELERGCLGRAG